MRRTGTTIDRDHRGAAEPAHRDAVPRGMTDRRPIADAALLAGALVLLSACEGGGGPVIRFIAHTPHEAYEAQLREANLDGTALGRDWLAVADDVLEAPVDVDAPYQEARFLDPSRATAVAYRLYLERGQRLVCRLDLAGTDGHETRFFLDLFYAPDSTAQLHRVAAADSSGRELEYVALRPGVYVVRIQPELLRGGRVTLTLLARASLGFPVVGRDMAAIRSRFGAPRDAGRRTHQGLDIFAPRGTPVIAATAGRVSRVGTTGLGGNVVWLREGGLDRRLYYAHLDSQAVREGAWVQAGDTLGFVGNTGNARTTPPHLHFGIYMRGEGAVDPYFHLLDPPSTPMRLTADVTVVGTWARIREAGADVWSRPERLGARLDRLPGLTPVEVRAGTGAWYHMSLPDGREGYVAAPDAEPLTPIAAATIVAGTLLRADPSATGMSTDSVAAGQVVPVLGRFGTFAFVEDAAGRRGWLEQDRLTTPSREHAPSTAGAVGGR